jgi:hypothetical protein
MATLFFEQFSPSLGTPLTQVHWNAWQSLWDVCPLLHDAQISAPSITQAAPVAAAPSLQVQVFALHLPSTVRVYPALQLPHKCALSVVHSTPMAGEPFSHEQMLLAGQAFVGIKPASQLVQSVTFLVQPVVDCNPSLTAAFPLAQSHLLSYTKSSHLST